MKCHAREPESGTRRWRGKIKKLDKNAVLQYVRISAKENKVNPTSSKDLARSGCRVGPTEKSVPTLLTSVKSNLIASSGRGREQRT